MEWKESDGIEFLENDAKRKNLGGMKKNRHPSTDVFGSSDTGSIGLWIPNKNCQEASSSRAQFDTSASSTFEKSEKKLNMS